MRRLTFRIAVSLLTFALGITATFLLLRGHSAERAQISGQSEPPLLQEKKQKVAPEDICPGPFPEVERVYLSKPLLKINSAWYEAYVIFFYKNGDWVRVWDEVRQEHDKFIFSPSDGWQEEVGRWKKEDNGVITISIEKRRCHMCGFNEGYHRPALPIIEHWDSRGAILGRTHVRRKKYRQISEEQVFHDLDKDESDWATSKILSPCEIRYGFNGTGEDF